MLWVLVSAVALAASGGCPLAVVRPPGEGVALAVGDRDLPRDSLVRASPSMRCAAGQGAQVVSVVPWTRRPGRPAVTAGARLCLPAEAMAPLDLLALDVPAPPGDAPAPGLPPGTAIDLTAAGDCSARGVRDAEGRWFDDAQLVGAVPSTPARRATAASVRAALEPRVGPLPPGAVWVNAWGRVALPMATELDRGARAALAAAEGLDTPTRQEKVTEAWGPGDAWSHFLGSDAQGSDRWGTPAFVVALGTLAADWRDRCATLPAVEPDHCLLQVGDLSWYRAATPDPLGHRDHAAGDCVDLRLFRDDGSRYEAFWDRPDDRPGRGHRYHASLTAAFVAFALARPETRRLLLNDPAAGGEPARGHDDHIHLCLGDGGG